MARIDVRTMTEVERFRLLPSEFPVTEASASELAVAPGDPDTVAVLRLTYGSDGVEIYTHGVPRPIRSSVMARLDSIGYSASADRLYGYNGTSSDYSFYRMDVGPAGVSVASVSEGLIQGYDQEIHYDDSRIFADTGAVLDPEGRVLLATLPQPFSANFSLVTPDVRSGVIWAAGGGASRFVVHQFDPTYYTLRQSVIVPGLLTSVRDLVGAGPDRAALSVGTRSTAMTHVALVPFNAVTQYTVTVNSRNPADGVTIDVSLSGTGSGTGVTPFQRNVDAATSITLVAPESVNGHVFSRWLRDGTLVTSNRVLTAVVLSSFNYVAVYEVPAPNLLSVAPPSGPVSGGTAITMSGTSFLPGATVTFGPNPATQVVVDDSSTITAVTPPGATGAVAVGVRNPDGQFATLASGFTYIEVPGYFVKSFPANAATGVPGVVVLSWGDAPQAQRYEYCLDTTLNSACDGTWASTGLGTARVRGRAGSADHVRVAGAVSRGERVHGGQWRLVDVHGGGGYRMPAGHARRAGEADR